MINQGDRVPALELMTSDGRHIDLGRLGAPMVLYFYPKDDTSGCTRQAQDFTALAAEFEAANVPVVGVSRDPMKRHEKFIGKYELTVPLASDEDGRISDAFGTWVQKSMYGRKYMGMERSTFLIGKDSIVIKAWRKVKVPGHAQEVLEAARGSGAVNEGQTFRVCRLVRADIDLMQRMLPMFAEAFDEPQTYARPPRSAYFDRLLGNPEFVALAAVEQGEVIGGLIAYELVKYEAERSEFYIYDLAVRESARRRGVATALIAELQRIAAANAADVIFVQADRGDDPAIALYSKLGRREDVLHFDIPATAVAK